MNNKKRDTPRKFPRRKGPRVIDTLNAKSIQHSSREMKGGEGSGRERGLSYFRGMVSRKTRECAKRESLHLGSSSHETLPRRATDVLSHRSALTTSGYRLLRYRCNPHYRRSPRAPIKPLCDNNFPRTQRPPGRTILFAEHAAFVIRDYVTSGN
jgi:hypothetical protein